MLAAILLNGRAMHSRDLDGLTEALVDCPDVMAPPRRRKTMQTECGTKDSPLNSANQPHIGDSQPAKAVS